MKLDLHETIGLDLIFEAGKNIHFSVSGKNPVQLLGYFIDNQSGGMSDDGTIFFLCMKLYLYKAESFGDFDDEEMDDEEIDSEDDEDDDDELDEEEISQATLKALQQKRKADLQQQANGAKKAKVDQQPQQQQQQKGQQQPQQQKGQQQQQQPKGEQKKGEQKGQQQQGEQKKGEQKGQQQQQQQKGEQKKGEQKGQQQQQQQKPQTPGYVMSYSAGIVSFANSLAEKRDNKRVTNKDPKPQGMQCHLLVCFANPFSRNQQQKGEQKTPQQKGEQKQKGSAKKGN